MCGLLKSRILNCERKDFLWVYILCTLSRKKGWGAILLDNIRGILFQPVN